jgi:palmitoyltransferase ZDHHC6
MLLGTHRTDVGAGQNCIGYRNYGHFIRFLFYVDVACAYHLWMISSRVFGEAFFHVGHYSCLSPHLGTSPDAYDTTRAQMELTTSFIVVLVLNYVTCMPVLLCVGIFSLYHFYSMLSNTTTIEGWEKDKVATLMRRGHIEEVRQSCAAKVV